MSGGDGSLPDDASRVRLALLDDHELLLDSIGSWIAAHAPDFDLVVSVGTWIDLVRSPAFPAALVLMDFQLKETVSIEARIRTCRAAGAKVIVMSALDTSEARSRALDSGASSFCSKAQPMAEIMDVARVVMGLGVSQSDGSRSKRSLAAPQKPRLSPAELDALQLYVEGHSTSEVARLMNVKYETAKTYLRRVREKYAKANRPASRKAELIRRAAEDGYLQ
ncbi:helix-turn-helix transcriptional regulator [Luethyella okanaganae]|uniref:Helix-turn-helix transcriptional regulator n=1 Tax=Luethyella okanaganae TaxID=69372 RepID=A0ABW1VAS4_9MICO